MIGLPHSGHSMGVSGNVSSSMVFSTSTKGTCATTARHSSGRQVRRDADQRAARGSARDGDAARRGKPLVDEVLCDIHEVVERVFALLQLAVEVPLVTEIIAAADVRDGESKAAVEQGQTRAREAGRHRVTVGAVP